MEHVKRILRRLLPIGVRNFVWYWRSPELRQSLAAAKMIKQRLGARVLSGPFAGLEYIEHSIGSSYPPKLLGTYEKELGPVLDEILRTNYQTVVDIGAAEGYYAVGVAWRNRGVRVVAFEAQTDQHALLIDLARRNEVDSRVALHGFCTPTGLKECLDHCDRALVICDCEGFERELLDASQVTALVRADMLVETHDFLRQGVSAELRGRWSGTHDIVEIASNLRTQSDWPAQADFVPDAWRLAAMQEYRAPGQTWLWMKSNVACETPSSTNARGI